MPNRSREKINHHNREDLVGEHRLGDAGQLILILLFLGVWITDSYFLKKTTFLNQIVPAAIRLFAAAGAFISGGYLSFTGMRIVFGKDRVHTGVIREKVFDQMRHPIYFSELLLYLGFLCLSLSLAAAAVWVVTAIFLHVISRYEETLLIERFGDEYRRYIKEVPMWIPRFRKKALIDAAGRGSQRKYP
jgi:protein-S-isoprenylcysteine O-methyltransferase Ste14